MEERISQLEELVTELRIDNGRRDQMLEHINKNLTDLNESVTKISAVMNRGAGVLWVFTGVGALLCLAIGAWFEHLFNR